MDSVYFVGPNSIGNSVTGAQICPIFDKSPIVGITFQPPSSHPLLLVPLNFNRTSSMYCSWILHLSFDQNPLGTGSMARQYVPSLRFESSVGDPISVPQQPPFAPSASKL